MKILIVSIISLFSTSVLAGPCVDNYTALANRKPSTLQEYLKYEQDYIAQNVATARRMPQRDLQVTENNWRNNLIILQLEATNRAKSDWCIREGLH